MYPHAKALSVQYVLFGVCSVFGFSQGLLWIIQPILVENIALNITDFNKVMGLGSALFLLGIPFWWLVQRCIGYRNVLSLALLLVGVSQLLLFIICTNISSSDTNTYLFILSRIIYGMSASTLVPTSQTIMEQVASDKVIGYSRLSVGLSVGRLGAPLVALPLLYISNSAPTLSSTFCFFLIFITFFLLDTGNTENVAPNPVSHGLKNNIYRVKQLKLILSVALLIQLAFGIFQFILAIWLINTLHWSTEYVTQYMTWLLIICSLSIILAQFYMLPRCRNNPSLLILLGGIFAITLCTFIIHSSPILIGISFVLMVTWTTLAYPLYLHIAMKIGGNLDKGFITSLIAITHTTGYSIGGGASGYFYEIAKEGVFITILVIFTFAFYLFYFLTQNSNYSERSL